MQISNEDLFIQFYECIREGATINEVCKNYGGGNIYVPSFKSLGRNNEIVAEYDKRIQEGQDKNRVIRELAVEYSLTYSYIYNIIKANKEQPTLF